MAEEELEALRKQRLAELQAKHGVSTPAPAGRVPTGRRPRPGGGRGPRRRLRTPRLELALRAQDATALPEGGFGPSGRLRRWTARLTACGPGRSGAGPPRTGVAPERSAQPLCSRGPLSFGSSRLRLLSGVLAQVVAVVRGSAVCQVLRVRRGTSSLTELRVPGGGATH